MMERKIFVYENFSSLEPKKLGVLYVDTLRGIEHYSFEYDQDWLKQSKFSFCLDPDISMFSGRQYKEHFWNVCRCLSRSMGTNPHETT